MNAPFVVAQATGAAARGAPVQTIKLYKPAAGETVVFHASHTGTVKIIFTDIANEKITLYKNNAKQQLHIIFADGSQAIIVPFYDSTGSVLANFIIEVGPNLDLTGAQFALQFPTTTDQAVLPAAGEGGDQGSSPDFHDPSVDPLALSVFTPLLLPEELPPIQFTDTTGSDLPQGEVPGGGAPPPPPFVLAGAIGGLVEEEHNLQIIEETDGPVALGSNQGNEDPNDITDSTNPFDPSSGLDLDTPFDLDNTTNAFGPGSPGYQSLATLVVSSDGPPTFSFEGTTGTPVLDTAGNPVTSGGDAVKYFIVNPTLVFGFADGDNSGDFDPAFDRLVFTLFGEPSTGDYQFALVSPIDHPTTSNDDGTNPIGAFEETLSLDLSSLVVITDGNGPHTLLEDTFTIAVIDDTPTANPEGVDPVDDEGATANTSFTGNPGGDGDLPGQSVVSSFFVEVAGGADGVKDITFADLVGPAPFMAIHEDAGTGFALQEAVSYEWDAGTHTLTARGDVSTDVVFTLVIDNIATGAYTFTLNSALVHSDAFENVDLQLVLPFTVIDGDDDQAHGTFTVDVNDDTPLITVELNEPDTENGLLALDPLDETTDPDVDGLKDGDDTYNAGETTDDDGDLDDVDGDPTPAVVFNQVPDINGANPIGRITTAVGVENEPGDLGSLFDVDADPGADGAKGPVVYDFDLVLSDVDPDVGGVQTTLKVTQPYAGGNGGTNPYFDPTVWLFVQPDGSIHGRFQTTTDGVFDGVAFKIYIENPTDPVLAQLVVEQYAAIDHDQSEGFEETGPEDPSEFDEAISMLLVDTVQSESSPVLGVKLTVTLTDGDDDVVSQTSEVVMIAHEEDSSISIDDDGPRIDIDTVAQASLAFNLDESIGDPTTNPPETGSIAPDDDLFGVLTAPNGVDPIGRASTEDGDVSGLFTTVLADAGTDGEKDRTDTYTLTLTDAFGNPVAIATTFATSEGVETTLQVTDADGTFSNDVIHLFKVSDTLIEGRVDTDGDGNFDDANNVALRITLDVVTDPADPIMHVDQILAIEHPDNPDNYDEPISLGVAALDGPPDATAGIGVTKTSELVDGDDDTATDSATVNITSGITIEDDGPSIVAESICEDDGGGEPQPARLVISASSGVNVGMNWDDFTPALEDGDVIEPLLVDPNPNAPFADVDIFQLETAIFGEADHNIDALYVLADGRILFSTEAGKVDFAGGDPRPDVTPNPANGEVDLFVYDPDDNSVVIASSVIPDADFSADLVFADAAKDKFDAVDLNSDDGSILFSIEGSASITGVGSIDGNDLIRWDGTTATRLFDLSDLVGASLYDGTPGTSFSGVTVELVPGEIGGVHVLEYNPDGSLGHFLISIVGDMELSGNHAGATGDGSAPDKFNGTQLLEIQFFEGAYWVNALPFFDSGRNSGGGNNGDEIDAVALIGGESGDETCDPIVVHDETAEVQNSADPNAQNDALGSTLPVAVLALFNAITDKGVDPDASSLDNGAIGFARSGAGVSPVTFTADFGTDGAAASDSVVHTLSIPGGVAANGTVDSGVDTTAGLDVYLFMENGLIVGRVDLDDDGSATATDPAAFALAIDSADGELFVAQYLSLKHPLFPATFDEQIALADDAVQVTVTVTDGDGDQASSSAFSIGHLIGFQDDGPVVTVGAGEGELAALAVNLDESIDSEGDGFDAPPTGEDIYNGAETESNGGASNGDLDDISGQTAVDGTNPIGSLTTTAGALSALFNVGTLNAGTDGQKSVSYAFALALSAAGLATTLAVTQPAASGNPDSDNGGAPNTPYANPTIYLFNEGGVIVGRVGTVDGGLNPVADPAGDIALRITLNDPDTTITGDETLTIEQILAIDHSPDQNAFDTEALLNLVEGSLDATLTVTLTDGDDDTATSETFGVTLIDGEATFVSIDDDGPRINIDLEGRAGLAPLELDESINGPTGNPPETGSIAPAADDISGVTTVDGTNPFGHVQTAANAIANLFSDILVDAGTDGTKTRTDAYTLTLTNTAGTALAAATTFAAAQGVQTTLEVTDTDGTTYVNDVIYLFKISDTVIEGRVDTDGNGTFDDANNVALRITLTNPANPILNVDQILAIEHPNQATAGNGFNSFDESVTLGFANVNGAGGGIGVTKTSTLTDGDNDTATDSATKDITSAIVIEDDGITVDIAAATFAEGEGPSLTLDESIGLDAGDANAEDDDNGAVVAPSYILAANSALAIGVTAISESGGSLGDLFTTPGVAQATDGVASQSGTGFSFTLKDAGGAVVTNSTTGVATQLVATDTEGTVLDGLSATALTIWLFQLSPTEIVGVVGRNADGTDDLAVADYVALRAQIVGTDLIVEQYLPIEHPTGGTSSFDEALAVLLADADASLGVTGSVTVTDGDGDTHTGTATFVLATSTASALSIEDDGPSTTLNENASFFVNEDDLNNFVPATGFGSAGTSPDPAPDDAAGDDPSDGSITNGTGGATPVSTITLSTFADFGTDGPGGFALVTITTPVDSGLTSKDNDTGPAETVLIVSTSTTLTGYVEIGGVAGFQAGDRPVFTLELLDADTGELRFTLLDQVDHAAPPPGTSVENLLDAPFDLSPFVQVADADGDIAALSAGQLTVDILDDVPFAFTPEAAELENSATSTVTADLDDDANLDDDIGADEPAKITFANITNGQNSGLTSGTDPIYLYFGDNGTNLSELIGSTVTPAEFGLGTDPADEAVFTVALNHNPSGNDTYTVTMVGTVDNGAGVSFEDLEGTGNAGNPPFKIIESTSLDNLQVLFTPINDDTVNSDTNDIGVGGQFIDITNPDQGLRVDFGQFTFHPNGGGSSDDGFTMNSHQTVNGFRFSIDQVSNGTIADVHLKAYNANEGAANQTISTHNFADDPLVAISQVQIYNDLGALVGTANADATFGGIGVDFLGDGTVVITGLLADYSVVTRTAAGYDRIEILNAGTGGSDGKFSLSNLQLETVTTGDPITMNFDVALTDNDGDSTIANIDVTLNPVEPDVQLVGVFSIRTSTGLVGMNQISAEDGGLIGIGEPSNPPFATLFEFLPESTWGGAAANQIDALHILDDGRMIISVDGNVLNKDGAHGGNLTVSGTQVDLWVYDPSKPLTQQVLFPSSMADAGSFPGLSFASVDDPDFFPLLEIDALHVIENFGASYDGDIIFSTNDDHPFDKTIDGLPLGFSKFDLIHWDGNVATNVFSAFDLEGAILFSDPNDPVGSATGQILHDDGNALTVDIGKLGGNIDAVHVLDFEVIGGVPVPSHFIISTTGEVFKDSPETGQFREQQLIEVFRIGGQYYVNEQPYFSSGDDSPPNTGHDIDAFALAAIPVDTINDAPAGTDNSINLTEDVTYVLQASDFGFTDVDGHNFAGVVIDTLPAATAGVLRLGNTALAAGTFVTAEQIADGSLIYTPLDNVFGNTGDTSFTFSVRDDGPTGGLNVNEDQTPNTMTLNMSDTNFADTANAGGSTAHNTLLALNAATQSILDSGGTDSIRFDTAAAGATVFTGLNFFRTDNNLEITWNSASGGGTITLLNQFVAANAHEQFGFDDGGSFAGYNFIDEVGAAATYDLDLDFTGDADQDILAGTAANQTLDGGGNDDLLFGNGGDDILNGGTGRDLLVGGLGDDTYTFNDGESGTTIAAADVISGFDTASDLIELSAVDAISGGGDQNFAGNGGFTQSGSLVANGVTWFQSGADTIVQMDTNGNTASVEMMIVLTGVNANNLSASNFNG